MAKKKQTSRGSRPRRPKRIISGITEFIDEDWWKDSRGSSSLKTSSQKTRSGKTDREDQSESPEKAAKEKTSTVKPKRKKVSKAKPAAAKTARAKKEPAAEKVTEKVDEAQPRSKRKRSRRKTKEAEPVTSSTAKQKIAKQKPVVEEPSEAPKKKRRRRSRRRKSDEASTPQTAPVEAVAEPSPEPETPSPAKSNRRRRSDKKEAPKAAPEPSSRQAATSPSKDRRQKRPPEPEKPSRREPLSEELATPPERKRRKKEVAKEEKPSRGNREKTTVTKKTKAAVPPKSAPKKKRRARTQSGFGAMDLSEAMFEALELAGYSEPTPIQAGLIPEAIKGIDLMGQAQTGTGKTAAFAIPLLEMVDEERDYRGPQALVMVPTRELAVQVRDECAKLADTGDIQVVAVYGGKPIRRQIEKLQRAPEIVVGTPGRVIDLNARGALFFGDLRQVVLDEADRMLDIGFRPDIEKILRRCPESRQTLLFSATLPGPVLRLAKRYMRDPEVLDFSPKNIAVETIDQFYFTVDKERKFDLLLKLLERENPTQAIVFCRTRRGTEKIYRRLSRQNLESVACIHGDLAQSNRDATMRKFRSGKLQILIATDVVGRGIDVSGVSHIINYDIPEFCDDYIHRVGRTGRMGREGVAYSFITPEEGPQLTRIEMRINILLKRAEMPGFDMGVKELSEEDATPPESKPVYGRRVRRVRRAL